MVDPRRALATCLLALVALSVVFPAATAKAEDSPVPQPVLSWPLADTRVVNAAALPPLPWLPGHRGIDVVAVPGQAVLAPGPGRVAFVGTVAGRDVVTIALDVGVTATLEPVTGSVTEGTRLARGEPVGVVTQTAGHCAPQTCVHWGVKFGQRYLDPLDWLEGFGPIVLLPLAHQVN